MRNRALLSFDPLAEQRKFLESMKPVDPLAEQKKWLESMKPVDPMAEQRKWLESMKPFDPLAEQKKWLESMKPVDPMAEQRKWLESMKPVDPMAESRRLAEEWKGQSAFDALAQYRRIAGQAAMLTGSAIDPLGDSTEANAAIPADGSAGFTMPSAALVVALVGIAWTCAWMAASGVSVEAVGSLFIEAVALAIYLNGE